MAGKHLKEQQPFSGLSEKLKQLCALCDEKISNDERIKKTLHIVYHDDFELKHEKHVFNTDEGFEEWKKEEEIRTKSSFVKRGGAKKVTNKQFTYYMCHRSGISIIKSGRKRNEKIGGSVKCGKTCPSFMTSIREQQEAVKITVEYQSVHAGREMEVGKLNLHGDDRRNLAALLKAGVPSTKTS
ncbi:c2H2-type domain-containing protein [Trichonephila clavipes]|nr:c2H2-type domain-containing protein [Trichonephila clavipes]